MVRHSILLATNITSRLVVLEKKQSLDLIAIKYTRFEIQTKIRFQGGMNKKFKTYLNFKLKLMYILPKIIDMT